MNESLVDCLVDESWEKKCWGWVKHLFNNPHAAVSLLKVMEGWQCSAHWHRNRANLFIVLSGSVEVKEWPSGFLPLGENPPAVHLLGPGDSCLIPSLVVHQFVVKESGCMVEVYWPDGEVRRNDIERLIEGGPA